MLLIHTRLQNPTLILWIKPQKKGHRIPRRLLPIINAMHRRLEPIIRQPLQEIPDIDHQRARDGPRVQPLVGRGQHLQPAGHVLPQQRQALDVGVRADADVDVLSVLGIGGGGAGVMDVDCVCAGGRHERVEVGLGQVEREGEDADEFAGEREPRKVEGGEGAAEGGEVRGVGPDVVCGGEVGVYVYGSGGGVEGVDAGVVAHGEGFFLVYRITRLITCFVGFWSRWWGYLEFRYC